MHTATHTETLVADHAVLKKLGRWTEATSFAVRARRSSVVLDLRALDSEISESGAAIEVAVDADHSVITLLVAPGSAVDADDVRWTGRGRVHDARIAAAGSSIRVTGAAHDSQLRVYRGGVAQLTAMLSGAYLRQLRESARTGTYPTIDDPTRAQR